MTDINDFRPEEVNEAILFAINNGWVRPPRWVPRHGDLVLDRTGATWVAIIGSDGNLRLSLLTSTVAYDEWLNEYGPPEPWPFTPDAA